MSKNSAKRRIKHLGTMLFVLYILLLIYFLFFSEEYGRVAAEERVYRYNLIPFVEIRRFWTYREQLGVFAVVTNLFGNVIGFVPYGFISKEVPQRIFYHFVRIRTQPRRGDDPAYYEGRMFRCG